MSGMYMSRKNVEDGGRLGTERRTVPRAGTQAGRKDEVRTAGRSESRAGKQTRGRVEGQNEGRAAARTVSRAEKQAQGRAERQNEGRAAVRTVSRAEKQARGREERQNENLAAVRNGSHAAKPKKSSLCSVSHQCGGCQYLDMPYEQQLKMKQERLQKLLGKYCKVKPVIGMDNPFHYRNKVHAVFGYHKGEVISGVYQEGTHNLVPVEKCMIEDEKADEIIGTIRGLLKSFKIKTYDEDTGYGLLRHVLIRRGFATGQLMVVLVTASPVFPSKNNFVKALREKHPEITTIVQNINGRGTSMILGDREHVLYGKGYIEDILCGCRFRISSKSFYQVNSVQTEKLYAKAIELAALTGNELVLDAYCGIGTIGIIASKNARQVIGVELNPDAVRDAIQNAKCNAIRNIRFYCNDATKFMQQMAAEGAAVDVVLMDPPRSGSTEEFIRAVKAVKAKHVIYVSCGPESLARDLEVFGKMGYEVKEAWGVDMFAMTEHVECAVKMTFCGNKKK